MPNPFGLLAGSTPSGKTARYIVDFYTVPNPHPDMKAYVGMWDPDNGLLNVTAHSEVFQEDQTGFLATRLYDRLKRQLSLVYGPCHSLEYLDRNSIWDNENEFARSVLENDRVHLSQWNEESESKLDSGVRNIKLYVTSDSDESLRVVLCYNFSEEDPPGPADDVGVSSL
jgi:hypothetical protein